MLQQGALSNCHCVYLADRLLSRSGLLLVPLLQLLFGETLRMRPVERRQLAAR